MMVNVPLFAGNPQLQEQLRLQLPVFLQQVSTGPRGAELGSGLRPPALPTTPAACLFPRCRIRSPCLSSPIPGPCRPCCRSSRDCRPYRLRPPGWYPGEGQCPLPPLSALSGSLCVPEDLLSHRPWLFFLLDLIFPTLLNAGSYPWPFLPAALALLGCPGPQRPQRAAALGLRPRAPPLRQPRLLPPGLPVPSSSSCSR